MLHVTVVCVFLLQFSILLYEYTKICFAVPLLIDILSYFVFGSIEQNVAVSIFKYVIWFYVSLCLL